MSDIDPEEVRRRLGDAYDFRDRPIHAAAREWLRLREQDNDTKCRLEIAERHALTCSCDVIDCCETPVSHRCGAHADGVAFSDAAARREGVIEGLELALLWSSNRIPPDLIARIRAKIERLKDEGDGARQGR